MQSNWSDAEAKDFVSRYAAKGVNADLALRTYTTRLLGSDPRLVLHGGGNTSVKTVVKDMLGEDVEVICIKGSGWDMGNIEPQGLPAVKLEPLRQLRTAGQAVRRGHGQLPAHQSSGFHFAQSLGGNAASRLPAAQIHRPRPFHRGAGPDRPARWRGGGARSLWRQGGLCALHHSRLRAGQVGGRCVRQKSQVWKAWCCFSTASSPWATRPNRPMAA